MGAKAAQAQDTDHLFPQFVNGQAGGGVYYSSKIHVVPWFTSTATINCSLRFYGIQVDMGTLGFGDTFNFSIQQNGGWALLSTVPSSQNLVSGYATLTCSTYVYAYVDYALYGPAGKLGGATVFSADDSYIAHFIADQAEPGARLGIAIANNTDLQRTYNVTIKNAAGQTIGTTQLVVGARRAFAKFLDEMAAGTTGIVSYVTVQSPDFSYFGAVGLRFVGGTFSTLPASN
jgi:hypothetical protein